MLAIICTWIYAFITLALLGFGVNFLLEKAFHYEVKSPDGVLMAGIVSATVYAQIFSLFYKIGFAANVGLVLLCGLVLFGCRSRIFEALKYWNREYSTPYKVIILFLVILWAYFSSRGYFHYDSDLYHGQSIRWLEEYGVVPGLGNLHERFAYNSSFFALSALYSLKFVLGRSMHAMNGFIALLLSVTCLRLLKCRQARGLSLAGFARVGAVYYLTLIVNEVVAPASDYAVMCVLFFIVIKWLDALEKEPDCIEPFALLCVAGAFTLTLKLTAGLILLLILKPAYMLISGKKWKEIGIYLAMGLLVAVPWFARTVIISGWLIYPFTGLDLFGVDWKMEAFYIDLDAAQIKAWGRALYNVALLDTPLWQWLSNWFTTTLSVMEKLLVAGASAACAVTMADGVRMLLTKAWKHLDLYLVMLTLSCSYLFWQTSAPLMRYGYAYVLLLTLIVFGWLANCLLSSGKPFIKLCYRGVLLLFALYGIYKIWTMAEYISQTYVGYYIWPQTYGTYELESYEIEGETFYYPVYGDRTGYESFPSAPTKVELKFRGDSIKEGFCK